MTFNKILTMVRKTAAVTDISGIDFLAVQVNLTGENGGVFYVEVKDGRVNVEPYDYHDRNCAVTISGDDFVKLANGKLDPVDAFKKDILHVDGDLGKAMQFASIVKK